MTSIFFLAETIQCKQLDEFIRKTKNFFLIFLCIFQIYIKFWTFWETDHLHSLYFSEVTDHEKRG